jgi:N4-(beta-N-acetylglucosaminyl)-L-asparaginase
MIALDANGDLSAAPQAAWRFKTWPLEIRIIGAGLYVDNEIVLPLLQHGEEVIRITGCHLVVELMRQGKSHKSGSEEVMRIVNLTQKRNKI